MRLHALIGAKLGRGEQHQITPDRQIEVAGRFEHTGLCRIGEMPQHQVGMRLHGDAVRGNHALHDKRGVRFETDRARIAFHAHAGVGVDLQADVICMASTSQTQRTARFDHALYLQPAAAGNVDGVAFEYRNRRNQQMIAGGRHRVCAGGDRQGATGAQLRHGGNQLAPGIALQACQNQRGSGFDS